MTLIELASEEQQEVSWFTGILEAEGHAKKANIPSVYGQSIGITNTDQDILEACTSFLDKRCIKYGVYRKRRQYEHYKPCYVIEINSRNDCWTLLKILGNYFQCRRREFLEKLEFESQEEIALSPNLNWLVGITEGEGYFSIDYDSVRECYSPVVQIKNTDTKIIQRLILTLRANGLSWCSSIYRDSSRKRKEITSLRMNSITDTLRFLRRTKGLWRSDHYSSRAILLLEFVSSRALMKKRLPYTDRQREIYEIMKL